MWDALDELSRRAASGIKGATGRRAPPTDHVRSDFEHRMNTNLSVSLTSDLTTDSTTDSTTHSL